MRKWLFGLFLFAAAQAAFGQISLTKTCDTPVATGSTFNCSYTVENLNGSQPVRDLVVTNTVDGVTTTLNCFLDPSRNPPNVTVLGSGQSCGITFTETAPGCAAGTFSDVIHATGNQVGIGAINETEGFSVTLTGTTCTPTPTNTPPATNTPTPTPTVTPTPTPTRTPALGLILQKSCVALPPPGPLAYSWRCSFTVTNLDTVNSVTGLSLTYTVNAVTLPAPSCHQGSIGGPVTTTLGVQGSGNEQCFGQVDETVFFLSCPANDPGAAVIDIVAASGTNSGGGTATGNVSHTEQPATCTPNPGFTATPTITRTFTPTGTRSATLTPTVTPTGPFVVTNTRTVTPTPTNPAGPTFTRTPTVTPTPGAGLAVTKACLEGKSGKATRCTFTVQNLDPLHSVTNLTVLNVHPVFPVHSQFWPCGAAAPTVLGPAGSATDRCTGSLNEILDICDSGNPCVCFSHITAAHTVTDTLTARAFKSGTGWITKSVSVATNVTCP